VAGRPAGEGGVDRVADDGRGRGLNGTGLEGGDEGLGGDGVIAILEESSEAGDGGGDALSSGGVGDAQGVGDVAEGKIGEVF